MILTEGRIREEYNKKIHKSSKTGGGVRLKQVLITSDRVKTAVIPNRG